MSANIEWVFVVKKRLSWITEMLQVAGTAHTYFKNSLDVDFEFRNAKMLLFHEFLDANELYAFDEMIERALKKDRDYLHRVAHRAYEQCKTFTYLGNALFNEIWGDKSQGELTQSLEHLRQQALLMIPVVYFEPNLTERIRTSLHKLLQKTGQEESLDEYFLLLTSTTKELTIIREQRDLLKIGVALQEQPALSTLMMREPPEYVLPLLPVTLVGMLQMHIYTYAWINTDDMFGRPWNETDLIARLKYLLRYNCQDRLHTLKEKQVQREQQRTRLIKELPVDGELLMQIEIAHENSHLRTHRTEAYVKTLYNASSLITEVARRVGLTYHEALYFSLDELHDALLSKTLLTSAELNQRKKGMSYIMTDRNINTFFGDEAIDIARSTKVNNTLIDDFKELKGAIANMGIARGIAKVVHDISELDKVEEGDILIASMTLPEFVPAMERAAAFVTDEGGITCHAAIISREMDIPCITGLEIATKLLHDGDFIEVDANNGLVRILH